MKKILLTLSALSLMVTAASAAPVNSGTIVLTNGGSTVHMPWEATDIGGGLFRYDVFLDDPLNNTISWGVQLLTFTGQINQKSVSSVVAVNSNDNAANFNGIGGYSSAVDSYFFKPFSDNLTSPGGGTSGIQDIAPGSNPQVANPANPLDGVMARSYLINAGTGGGSQYDLLQLAQIVATGDLTLSGAVGRNALTFAIPGGTTISATPIPEPSTFVLLGLGAVGLVGYSRRRRS